MVVFCVSFGNTALANPAQPRERGETKFSTFSYSLGDPSRLPCSIFCIFFLFCFCFFVLFVCQSLCSVVSDVGSLVSQAGIGGTQRQATAAQQRSYRDEQRAHIIATK